MGLVHIFERGGDYYHDYKKALMTAKKSIDILCDLTEEMEDEYGYEKRSGSKHYDDDYSERSMRRSRR